MFILFLAVLALGQAASNTQKRLGALKKPGCYALSVAVLVCVGSFARCQFSGVELIKREIAMETLERYLNQDLEKLEEPRRQEIARAIEQLKPTKQIEGIAPPEFQPRNIWERVVAGRQVLIVLEIAPPFGLPGTTEIRLTLLDKAGTALSQQEFNTAHRCYAKSAAILTDGKEKTPVILLTTTNGGLGPDYKKQYYALLDRRFDLVRIEDSDGKTTRNDYHVKHFAAGQGLPSRTRPELEADIFSDDSLRILRGLCLLGGIHQKIRPHQARSPQDESADQVEAVNHLLKNVKVQNRIKELSLKADTWINEGAKLALDPDYERKWYGD